MNNTKTVTACSLIYFLTLLFSLFFSQATLAALTASIDRNEISIDETFTLVLRSDQTVSGKPELTVLQQDFDVLGQQQTKNYSFINGKASSILRWNIQLAPKRIGRLNIPGIQVGKQQSLPLTINVSKSRNKQHKAANQEYFLDLELSQDKVYQQAEVIATMKLYTRIGLQDIGISEFSPENTQIQELDDNSYNTTINGRQFRVIEKRWALYPQTSGTLNLPSVTLQATKAQTRRGFFPNFNTEQIRLRSPAKSLEVLPIPDNYQGKFWLPASSLSLSETWSQNPDTIQVGDSITRTITTKAEGLSAEQLIPQEAPVLQTAKTYPDQSKLENSASPKGNQAKRLDTYAIIATQPGTLILPAIKVHWWDVNKQIDRVSALPERTITVLAAPGQANKQVTTQQQNFKPADVAAVSQTSAQAAAKTSLFWPIVSLILLTLLLLTLFLYWRLQQRLKAPVFTAEKQLAEVNQEALLQELLHALRQQKDTSRDLLIQWAKLAWPQFQINCLADFAHSPLSTAGFEQLQALDKHLFSGQSAVWDGQLIANELETWHQQQSKSSLQPLN